MEIALYFALALSLMLALTAALAAASKAVRLPTPLAMAAAGLLYGTVGAQDGAGLASWTLDSYQAWFVGELALDAQGLLLLFLPPLLFEMALNVDLRRLRDDAAAVAIMAIVAVIAATAIVGLSVWAGSGLSLLACLLLGAAVSTTDPAAVITTFREIGAPRRLLALLEGESLLNDAAAIALYALLLAAVQAGAAAPESLLADFARFFGIGALTGLGLAWLAARIYPLLGGSAAAETSITIAMAYGAHLLAEFVLGGSGVVAVVVAGAVTGSSGFVSMGPRNWGAVQAVWSHIGFWANAAILFAVASATPALLLEAGPGDAVVVALVYAGALAARAAVLFGLLPVLDRLRLSTPIETGQKTLLLWGGVRGSVTLVLALSLTEVAALGPEARVIGAAAAIYTFLTLALNASTLGWMTRLLKLNELSGADAALRERIAAGAIERVREVVGNMARARDVEPEAVSAVTQALVRRRREAEEEADAEAEGERAPFVERLRLGLTIVAGQEARLVRRAFEEGAIGPRATLWLTAEAERLADAARVDGRDGYDREAERGAAASFAYRLAYALHGRWGVDGPLRRVLELRQTALLETERVINDLEGFARARLPAMVGADAAANIEAALERRLLRVQGEFVALERQYPDYARALETALMSRAAVRRERQEYERLYRDGVIGPELYAELMAELAAIERTDARPPRLDLRPSPLDLVGRIPLFADLTPEQRVRVARRLRARPVFPGDVVAEIGERGDTMHLVVSGVLEVEGEPTQTLLENGDFFGELGLLAPSRRRRTRIVSRGYGQLLALSRRDFRRLADKEPDIERRIRAAAEAQLDAGFRPGRPSASRAAENAP